MDILLSYVSVIYELLFRCSLLAVLADKLRSAKLVIIKTKIVQLLRKIVVNHNVDCTFIAEEMTILLADTGD